MFYIVLHLQPLYESIQRNQVGGLRLAYIINMRCVRFNYFQSVHNISAREASFRKQRLAWGAISSVGTLTSLPSIIQRARTAMSRSPWQKPSDSASTERYEAPHCCALSIILSHTSSHFRTPSHSHTSSYVLACAGILISHQYPSLSARHVDSYPGLAYTRTNTCFAPVSQFPW